MPTPRSTVPETLLGLVLPLALIAALLAVALLPWAP